MQNKAYRSVAIKSVNISGVITRLAEGPVSVGVDVGKRELFVVVRDDSGSFERPWKVRQPTEIPLLLAHLRCLAEQRPVTVAMESTGTYGDVLRQALTDAGFSVQLINSHHTFQYAETFDGVPSNHDGKDAAILSELAAFGKSKAWPWEAKTDWEEKLEQLVDWLDAQQDMFQMWLGRLEARLARYWPELLNQLQLNSPTLLKTLVEYGSPARLVVADETAREKLAQWGGYFLSEKKIEAILAGAKSTLGVRMGKAQIESMQRYAQEALRARQEVLQAKKQLKALVKDNATIQRMGEAVGIITACVLWRCFGDPCKYHCGHAYVKAMGLNLKEHSSGKYNGKLKITKRGPSQARRWLYFSSLRVVQSSAVRGWFEAKKSRSSGQAKVAVIAVMRKLAFAVRAVAVSGDAFQPERLFPGRPWPTGALPPNPRNLSRLCQNRKGKDRMAAKDTRPPDLSTLAPGTALGSVSTGALSSAQSKKM